MKNRKTNSPRTLPSIPSEIVAYDKASLPSHERYEELLFSGLDLRKAAAGEIKIEMCRFKTCRLAESKIGVSRIIDTRFEECEMTNASFDKTSFERVEFLNCRMTGFKSIDCIITDVLFKGCHLMLSQFRMAKFKNVVFEDCVLDEADFYQADLTGTLFSGCVLNAAQFQGTKLMKTDFRASKIEGIRVDPLSIKGAIIDPAQAIDLVHMLGVTISPVNSEN